ncbi:PQQ-binding-like beta-propeller repeat protein [Actinoplanes oblitus]|uniref:PQQ-binding-like beta-propeller repeat protein n=1 Tax=Actinoplanes oblitus TaxID=3040509 RepID=A0ABY8WLP9_9ACTN|nr:PQQ-binding-like beta-propeller repeat protein [Actinoplanes oblitus]WIM98013.1 PQQ-binding-like beta-propeller repeat protein [Actinoplanes oblitus]
MLIDLDVAPAPAPERTRRIPWRELRATVAIAVLLLLGAAAAPPRIEAFPRVAGSGGRATSSVLLTPEALYTVQPVAGDGVDLVAQPMRPGGPAWRVRLSLTGGADLWLYRSGPVLVAADQTELVVLDPATGEDRWSTVSPAIVTGDRVLLTDYQDGYPLLRLADLATGRIGWTRRGSADRAMLDPAGRYLLTLDGLNGARVWSAADGRELARRSVTESIDPDDPQAVLAGDQAYVLGPDTVTALRLPDLAPVWAEPARVPMPRSAVSCGDLLCVLGERGLTAIDPHTGAVRWTVAGWHGYLRGVTRTLDERLVLLDPATGRVTRRLGRGEATGDLMLRAAGDHTEVTDLRTGRLYGTLPGVLPYGCTAVDDLVACADQGATVVFRIRRGS